MHARQVTQIPVNKIHNKIGLNSFLSFFLLLFSFFKFFFIFFLFFFFFFSFELDQRKNIELAFHTSIFYFVHLGAVILADWEQILQFEGSVCEISGFNVLPDFIA